MKSDSDDENIAPKKSSGWVIFLIIVLVILLVGAIVWWWWENYVKMSPNSIPATTSENSTPTKDSWVRDVDIIVKNTTSTCTIKLDNNSLRMYYMKDGKIVFADSTDGKSFGDAQSTGVSEDQGKMISNPAVLKIKNADWIMIYEQAPQKTPGEKEEGPGPENQRDLYLANSADGKSFTKTGLAIDSSKQDNYFASVPDLVLLANNQIRMYYVCGGEAICSAISTDGKTWTKESGIRLGDKAVDPDVLLQTKNGKTKYLMYFSLLTGAGNQLYKATSDDGLIWEKDEAVISPTSSEYTVVDPDIVKIADNKYYMYFAEAKQGSESSLGGGFNLYLAEMAGEIF